MNQYADLEVGLHRRPDGYAAELRFSHPQSDADVRVVQDGPVSIQFDRDRLRQLMITPDAYGAYLSECLFGSPSMRAAFDQVRSAAQLLKLPLRIRLFIAPSAPDLHFLRWETLRDPRDGSPLLTGEQVVFSRYLMSSDARPVRVRPQGRLRALVVIANPADLTKYKLGGRALEPVDSTQELERARNGLGDAQIDTLESGGKANLNAIGERLRAADHEGEPYDILYLVAHGALFPDGARVWLEREDTGASDVVKAVELVERIKEIQSLPRLVVLASCQSAGAGDEPASRDDGKLAMLGPLLSEMGIPAVLAMQANISMATIERFIPVFFKSLQEDGYIDRAVAVARGAVRDRHDAWVPVLFMRLRSGRIWYVPGFGDERFNRWPTLVNAIRQGRCTPIIGLGVSETLIGSSRAIARGWADTFHFPMAPHEREDLPQVAQFLAVNQDLRFPRDELGKHIRQELVRRYGDKLPEAVLTAPLHELADAVALQQQQTNRYDPNVVLASLPFPIYITTTPNGALETALTSAGRTPHVELCPWNDYVLHSRSDQVYLPTTERPMVYHLFGHLSEPDSLVLTEDDYFDYLIGVTKNHNLIPEVVRRALVDSALLFLGFQLDDWNFRVLFRSFMDLEGRGRRKRYQTHVAAQIDPEEERNLEPEGARRYLDSYFHDSDITIFWGSISDFIRQLHEKLAEQPANVR